MGRGQNGRQIRRSIVSDEQSRRDIQSIAAEQFLPQIDLRVDRERLDRPPSGAPDCKIILNRWYTHAPECWPPASFLKPLITSFHISREVFPLNVGGLSAADVLMRGESLRYLRDHKPVGARDLYTLDLLRQHGVESYFSGCLTLTLGSGNAAMRGEYVCAETQGFPVGFAVVAADRVACVRP
jgi:hypothetical protein